MANKLKVKNQKVNEVPTSLANKYANDNATAVADKDTKKDITRDKKQTYTKPVPTKTTEEFFRERMSRYTPNNQISTGALKNEVKPKTNDELKSFVKSRMSMYAKDNTDDHTKASGYSDYYMSYLKKAGKDSTRATSFADAKKEEKKRTYTSSSNTYNLMDDYSKQDLENLYKSDTNAKELARVGANKKGNKLSEAKNRIQKILEANEKQKEQSRKFFGDNKRNIKNIDEYKYKILRNEYAYDMMTDEQKEVYNYLYATKSPEYANTYKSMLDDELNAKVGKQEYEQTLDNKSGFEKFGKHVGTSIADSVHDTVIGNLNLLTGNKYIAPRSVDEFLSSEIRNDKDNLEAYNVALDLGSTIGRQVPGIAMSLATGIPDIGMITASLGASGSAYEDSIREGKTVNQARLYAAVQGGTEMVTGELLNGMAGIGEGVLSKALKSETASKAFNKAFSVFSKTDLGKKVMKTAYETGVDMFSEGLEEFIQEYIDKGSRNLIFGENNKISLDDPQAWYSAMLGAMSAGLLNAPGTAHDIRNDIKQANAPIDIKEGSYKLPEAKKYEVPNTGLSNKYIPSVEDVHRNSTEPSLYEKAYNLYMNNKLNEDNNVKPYYEAYNENIDTDTAYLHKTQEEIERVARDNDIKLSSIEESSNQFGEYGKNAFIENYEPKGSLNTLTYEDGFKAAYEAGKERLGHASISTPAYHMLSSEQQIAAYNAGLIDYERSNNVKPLANVEGGLIQTENETARYNNILADKVGKYTGLQVVVANELPHDANGAYHAKDNKMYLSLNAENYNAVAGHELTHFIKNYDEKNYNLYMDTVLKAYTSAKGKSIDNLITEYGSRYGSNMSRESILEEIVADGSAHFFNDEKFINNISKDNTSLGKSIVNFINDMIEAINNLISKTTNRDVADTLKANKKMYEKARKHWLDGLENASKINKSNLETREESKLKDTKSKGIVEDDKSFLRLDENRDTDDNLPFESVKWSNLNTLRKGYKFSIPIESVSKEKIDDNFKLVQNMSPVTRLKGDEFGRKDGMNLSEQVENYFKSIGGKANNKDVGDVLLDRAFIKSDIAHGIGRLKAMTFKAIPNVIENGKIVDYKSNRKERNYDSIIIAAPIDIEDGKYKGEYNIAVVVNTNSKKTLAYVHEVALTKKEESINSLLDSTPSDNTRTYRREDDTSSIESILRDLQKVNDDTKFSLKKEVEEGKNLIAVHNLTGQKLEKALELGAFPMPSVAITKSDMGHTDFGDISLVFGKETVDPSVKGQKVTGFNEIKYALIPSDEIEAIKGLRNKGVEVIEYARNKDIDPRVEILNSLDDVKFSIKKDTKGNNVVVIDESIINANTPNIRKAIANEIKTHIGEYYRIAESGYKIYLGKDLPGEYTRSKSAASLEKKLYIDKGKATANIDELIEIATNRSWVANRKEKHNKDAKYGWYKYDTRFAIPVIKDGKIERYIGYKANLIIRNDTNGKKYLYDMIKIEREHPTLLPPKTRSAITDRSLSMEAIIQETSNKVNTQNEIKNSLKLSDNASTDIKTLQKENSYLKRKVESLKEEFKLTKGYEPKSEDVDRMATRLKTSLNSRYSKEALSENLTKIFKYINKYNGEYTSDVMEISANLAKDVLQGSRDLEKSTNPELKEIRKAIKSYDIKLSDIDLAELEVLGGYDNIRKKYFGKLVLSKSKGLGVDSVYKELSSTYPWVFNENIKTTSDQLFRILDVISMTEDTNFNEYGMDTDEYAYMVAEDIFSMYFDVRQKQTFADIQKAKLEKTKAAYDMSYYERLKDLNEKHKKEMLEQRNRLKEDYKIKLREYKRENTKKIAELTKEYNKKMNELRKEKNASRDKAKIKELENKIAKLTKAQTQQINAHYNINYANILATNNSNPNEFIQSKELNRLQINPFIAKSDSDYAVANLDEKVKECCETYGIIPKGNNPLRDIDVPKAVSDEKKVSRLARTVLESDYVIDDLVEPIKEELLNGRFSYYEKSNSYASIQAENIIKSQGYNGAMTAWEEAVYRGNPSKEDIVLAEALLKIASENKKASDVLKILSQLQAVSTNAGQVVQAISMLKTNKVSEDLIKSIDLMAVKDIERNINRDLIKKYSNSKGYIPEVKLNEDLVKKLVEASTEEEVSKAKMEVIEDLANQIPSTWADKWNAWRYLGMLGNPKTHIRNVLGNAIFYPVVRMRNYISYSLENTVFNNASTKTKAIMIDSKYKEFANKDYDLVKDILDGGGKYDQMDLIRQKRTIFKFNGDTKIAKLGTKVLSGLEKASRFNSNMLELEDQIFISGYYKRFLAEYLQANKVDLSNVSEMSLNKAREYAINEAKKATYRDESKIASSLNNLARTSKGADIFVNGVLPFKKTPLKILQRSFEYSPFGVAKALTYDIKNVRSGKISINEYVDNLSAGITGSTLMALGFYMANLGLLSGGDDEDKNINTLERLAKKQNYSLKIGDYSYTLDWAVPISIPLFMGVELSKSFKEDNNDVSSVLDTMLNISAPMFNLSMLKGFNDILTAVSYAQGSNKITALGSAIVENYIGQAIPTILGQTARVIDPVQRGTYYDKNDGTPREVQRFLQKSFYNKLPFLSMKSEPVLDQFGNETVDDNVVSRVFQNFISPGYYKMQVDDEVYSEIDRLYKDTGEGKVILKNPKKGFKIIDENGDKKDYYMSASEYTAYKKLSGPLSYQLVHNLINDDRYSELEDMDRVAIIAKAYDYATQVSRYEINNSYSVDSFTTKAIEAYNEGVSLNDYLYYYQMLKTSGITKKKDRENFFENENLDTETKKALIKLLGK